MDIKERMANVGMTQVDMILELQKRGYDERQTDCGNAESNQEATR